MDATESLIPIFLYCATAPVQEINGKSLSEPAFAADPRGEIILNNTLAAIRPWRPQPDYLQPDEHTRALDKSGAYMHFLQNPRGVYPTVVQTLEARLPYRDLHDYPDPEYTELRASISRRYGLDTNGITLGTGSIDLLDRAIRTFGVPRGEVILTKPTWGFIWSFTLRHGLRVGEVPYKGSLAGKDLRPDLEGILGRLTYDTRIVYLVNPCNPTGTLTDKHALRDFFKEVPSHVTVILDEAYFDYCEPDKRFNLWEVLPDLKCRAIGLRTFSKFFALSGHRVGFAYSTPEVINYLNRLEVPFNVANVSQLAAIAALNDLESQKRTYDLNFQERHRMSLAMDQMHIDNMPSQTNFLLFHCPVDKTKMRNTLREQGIFMPNLDQVFIENFTVTTIGLPEHNQVILDFLAKY